MKRQKSPLKSTPVSTFSIIGGKWRRRKLSFNAAAGVRPTPNRARETLFNWLMHDIEDTDCLDLFAGSGALGFEALSRGAASCTWIDAERLVIESILGNLQHLDTTGQTTITGHLPSALTQLPTEKSYSLVFIDPPYGHPDLLKDCLDQLLKTKKLAKNAVIYCELSKKDTLPSWSDAINLIKDKTFGQVRSLLMKLD